MLYVTLCPRGCLQFVIVVFPDHTHLLFFYKRCARPGRPYDLSKFSEHKHLVWLVSDKACEKFLGEILGLNTDNLDHDVGTPPKVKTKTLYFLLKHSKQDSTGIVPLRKGAQILLTET